jgi:para-nitrobenzyl esterase
MSVNCLVASPLAKGLFGKAIAHSGASFGRSMLTLREAETEGEGVARAVGAASLADLRKMPARELLEKAKHTRRPIVDGYVLPETVPAIFAAGRQNYVALLTGWNEDEGLSSGPVKSAADFRQWAVTQYGTGADTFLQLYPAATDAEAAVSQARLSRDVIFGAQNYAWANAQHQAGKADVYVYRFTRKVPATGEYVKYGAFHTGEVPYAYDNLKFVDRPWEPVDHALARTMSAYWANFARSGTPAGNGLPEWPAYTVPHKRIMVLGEKPAARPLPDAPALDFLRANMKPN